MLSITFPLVTLLSFVRTKAGPYPGLTCKNSMILKISLLKRMQSPLRISEVDAIGYDVLEYPFIIPRCESRINCKISSLSDETSISASIISTAWVLL